MANVVISGTIKEVMPDKNGMYKGEVEVKRIFKGSNLVETLPVMMSGTHRMVIVEGFGDPHICESNIKLKDTRIFLLNEGTHGCLRLNSSIVRITVNNLDRTDAAVKGKKCAA